MTVQPYHVKLAKYEFMLLYASHQPSKNNDAQYYSTLVSDTTTFIYSSQKPVVII